MKFLFYYHGLKIGRKPINVPMLGESLWMTSQWIKSGCAWFEEKLSI